MLEGFAAEYAHNQSAPIFTVSAVIPLELSGGV
jgi:hypothetical protein